MKTKTEMLCPEGHEIEIRDVLDRITMKTYHLGDCEKCGTGISYFYYQCTEREVEGE